MTSPIDRLVYAVDHYVVAKQVVNQTLYTSLRDHYDATGTLTLAQVALLNSFVADRDIDIDYWYAEAKKNGRLGSAKP